MAWIGLLHAGLTDLQSVKTEYLQSTVKQSVSALQSLVQPKRKLQIIIGQGSNPNCGERLFWIHPPVVMWGGMKSQQSRQGTREVTRWLHRLQQPAKRNEEAGDPGNMLSWSRSQSASPGRTSLDGCCRERKDAEDRYWCREPDSCGGSGRPELVWRTRVWGPVGSKGKECACRAAASQRS